MIESRIRLLPLTSIVFPESRQRREINYAKVLEYATSICQHGLLQDIGIRAEDNVLTWGGHRFTAFTLLNDLASGIESPTTANYKTEELDALRALLPTASKTYEHWSKIPSKYIMGASPLLLSVLELAENLNREDLSWQEKAAAVNSIHKQAVADAREHREMWTDNDTAMLIGVTRPYITQLLQPERKLASIADPEVKKKAQAAVAASNSVISAANAVETIASRHGMSTKTDTAALTGLVLKGDAKPKPKAIETPVGVSPIVCADFNTWAASYAGPKFNFVHCDFPYGVDFNKAQGMGTSLANVAVGTYDDSEEIYWQLLNTLLSSRERLLESSTHIMFWLSVGLSKSKQLPMYEATKQHVLAAWPDAIISSVPLIWHCSDNSGLMPDPQRAPRRTYEWALQITLGDRKLAKSTGASFAHPRNSDTKLHRSQKHAAVLTHFFSMFVDSSTRMLDPTCGSGTSIVTAHKLGAKQVQGLELDAAMAITAAQNVRKETGL